MILRSPVAICLWCLSTEGELLHLHGRLFGFVKNKCKSILLANLLKLKNVVDIGGVSRYRWIFVSNKWHRKLSR